MYKLLLCLVLASASLFAQSPVPASPTYFVGAGFGSTPKTISTQTFWATFAKKVSEGTYNTTALDVLDGKTSVRTGVEKRLFSLDKLTLFYKVDGGVAATTKVVGLSGGAGLTLIYNIKGNFYAVVSASAVKSTFDPLESIYRAGLGFTFKGLTLK